MKKVLFVGSTYEVKLKFLEEAINEGEESGFTEGYNAEKHLKDINKKYSDDK